MKYLLLTMGGTIDSTPYSEKDGEYPKDSTPEGTRAKEALRTLLKPDDVLYCQPICAKDSKYIDERDKKEVAAWIKAASGNCDRIIVTMGTDTMCQTAQEIQKRCPDLTCPVVFTGSIWPLSNGEHSDGEANLRKAAFEKSDAKPGVFIAMGDVFAPADRVNKDFEQMKFYVVNPVMTAAPAPQPAPFG